MLRQYGADITISGDQEFSLQDSNGASTSALDGDFNIKASTETANGLSVSADINIAEDAADDGSASLTISGPFGKVDAGDTSSALDAVDDVTDWGYVLTNGTPNNDAALLYTLPTLVDGLTLNYSMRVLRLTTLLAVSPKVTASLPSTAQATCPSVTAFRTTRTYRESYVAVTYSMAGIGLAAEQYTSTTAAGVDTDTDSMSLTYSTGDITLAIETQKESSAGATSADITTMGIHYGMGGGVTAFVENTDDEQDATAETTAIGVAFKF